MHTIVNSLKDKVTELKAMDISEDAIRTILKESLQDHILGKLYSSNKFNDLVFVGGTALRKLYGLNRFSEDLDFSVGRDVNYVELGEFLLEYFKKIDFNVVDYSVGQSENVHRLVIKFEILKDVGLSGYDSEKLHVKIETTKDTIYETELFSKTLSNIPMVIRSYPLSTLMSGKILAFLNRVYIKGNTGITVKGRDIYDLIWYMEKQVVPLEAKLLEANSSYSLGEVFKLIDDRVEKISSSNLKVDLVNFFEDIDYINMWCENFKELYWKYRKFYN